MAITLTTSLLINANPGIPVDYVPTVLPALDNPYSVQIEVDLLVSEIENADVDTTISNYLAALTTEFTNKIFPDFLGFDAAKDITANATIKRIQRTRNESNDLISGVEVYKSIIQVDWSLG